MTKLYELSTEIATINEQIISADGEISDELERRLDALNLALTEKATGIRKWYASIESDEIALDNEIKRLQKIKKTNEHLKERLKEYVHHNMKVADLKKIQTPIGNFTLCPSPPSLEIVVPEMIPDEFKDTIPEHKEIDNARVKYALVNGYEVNGAKLITDKTHLRIS